MTKKQIPQPHEIARSALKEAKTEEWLDADGAAHVTVTVGHRREHFPVYGPDFESTLELAYLNESRKHIPGGMAIPEAVRRSTQNWLRARAMEKGVRHPTFIRVAHFGGRFYYDLINSKREVVEVDIEGYRTIQAEAVPVRFIRPSNALELPIPAQEQNGNAFLLLGEILGLSRETLVLIVMAALASTNPSGQYPILVLQGEKGSGKSTTARLFGGLLDPRRPQLASPPGNEDDLVVTAAEAHVLVLDNLSGISPELSDGLCRLATGGGFAKRKLYSNRGVERFTKTVFTVLNGIDALTDRDDLASRAIPVQLRSVSAQRLTAIQIEEAFNEALPRLLGALFASISLSISTFGLTHLRREFRMRDAVQWAVAAVPVLPFEPGEIEEVYEKALHSVTEDNAESDPIVTSIVQLLADSESWRGSLTELHKALAGINREVNRMSARKLVAALGRATPVLSQLGYLVRRLQEKEPGTRRALYSLEKQN